MTFFDCKAAVVEVYFAFALVHDSRGIEIINFTISLALSAGTLMASAGTPYRLVPAHFYPCTADLVGQLNGNGHKGMLQIDAPPVGKFLATPLHPHSLRSASCVS